VKGPRPGAVPLPLRDVFWLQCRRRRLADDIGVPRCRLLGDSRNSAESFDTPGRAGPGVVLVYYGRARSLLVEPVSRRSIPRPAALVASTRIAHATSFRHAPRCSLPSSTVQLR